MNKKIYLTCNRIIKTAVGKSYTQKQLVKNQR